MMGFEQGNRMSLLRAIFGLFLSMCLLASASFATDGAKSGDADEDRAKTLLARAVDRYRTVGDRALAEFSRQGEYVNRELYVYVLGLDGTLLASGGSSASLIGRNVAAMSDVTGKPFFAEMLHAAKAQGAGTVEYRWLNWADGSVQRKQAWFERVDDKVLAVGRYLSRSAPSQADAFLDQALVAFKAGPKAAIAEFNKLGGRFVQDDLYVFVVEAKTGRFVAHGVMPRLVGTTGESLRDRNGKPIIREMMAIAQSKGRGQIDYDWPNPVTKRTESKRTRFELVDGHIVAVGYYMK